MAEIELKLIGVGVGVGSPIGSTAAEPIQSLELWVGAALGHTDSGVDGQGVVGLVSLEVDE